MSGRKVHAIRIKLHTQNDCSVIIWPNDTAKLCVQLMNPRKTWMTKKPATKPVPSSTYPASLSTWPRRLSLKRFLFHILLRISDFFAANSSGERTSIIVGVASFNVVDSVEPESPAQAASETRLNPANNATIRRQMCEDFFTIYLPNKLERKLFFGAELGTEVASSQRQRSALGTSPKTLSI